MKKKMITISILFIFLCLLYGFSSFTKATSNSVRIIAHRGDTTHAPENTLPAVLSAIQGGADGIEVDVRCTCDGIPILFHDANLRRLTGKNLKVADLTCKEFLSYTLTQTGIVTSPEKAHTCTLEEVLSLAANYPSTTLHLELKISDAEEKVVSLIKKYDCSYEISSAKPAVLTKIKQLYPKAETFLLLRSDNDVSEYLRQNPDNVDGISVKSAHVNFQLVHLARKRNHKIYVWTVNDKFELRRLCRLGVDGIITDDPAAIQKMLS